MAFGCLKILSSKLVTVLLIVLYVHNLVAIANQRHELQGSLNNDYQDENGDLLQFESLSAALNGENDGLNVISSLASSVPINFDPPSLNFSEQPIGMSVIRKIQVNNPTHSLTLQLISISGDQPDFHSSFFTSKVLRPGESTSFEIVFLPRRSGVVRDTLLIQSSFGTYQYKIIGEGVPNIFRLRPLRGARIPVNATYSPSISMYNPFDSSLQIIEIYSSGGSLHLELPHGFSEGNKTVWEIRPYETKQVAKASFLGEVINNHTAFVRIKTNHSSDPSILLPVEVEVSEASGLFLSRELLDFGMIKSESQVRLPVYILNAGPHQVEVKSITPVPDNPYIKVEYTNTTLKPGSKYVKVAVLIFSFGDTVSPIDDSGVIKIWAEDKSSFHQLTVPYEAQILQGILDYEFNDTLFRAHDSPFSPTLRDISLINRFRSPIVIYSAKLPSKAQDIFSVENFNPPYVLQPDGEWHKPFRLRFRPHSSNCLMNTTLRLATNTSFFSIPLQCYDGSLEYDFGGTGVESLDFGMMSERDSLSKVFSVRNLNPVQISVTSLQVSETSNLPFVAVHLLSLPRQPKNEIMADGLRKGRRPPYYIHPGQQMVFSVNVTRPKRPGLYKGEILIYSSLGKVVTVPVSYHAVTGGLKVTPSHIKFIPTFPYSTSSTSIQFKSTYTKPIKLLSLNVSPIGDSPVPVIVPTHLPVIRASTTTTVGGIIFDPMLYQEGFNESCALHDLSMNNGKIELNEELKRFMSLWDMWQILTGNDKQVFEFALSIDTEIDKNITLTGTGPLGWPRLVDKLSSPILYFPSTLIGNKSEVFFEVHNPSSRPLVVELFFLHDVSHPKNVIQALSETLHDKAESFDLNINFTDRVYSIKDCDFKNSNDRLTSYTKIPKFILPPHGNQSLGMEFSPVSDHQTTELLLIRNNLTIFDFIELQGTGSRGFITVDGTHPGSTVPLHFEYTQQMMVDSCGVNSNSNNNNNDNKRDCELGSSGTSTDNSYTKVFIVRNSGPVPIMVTSTLGTQGQCRDRGFIVGNCGKPFAVYPNKTRKIDITCSPDYTLSRITTTLRLTTPTGPPMDYPILATLPHHMLMSCYSHLPRSEMESLASHLSVPLWIMALLVMITATVFQVNWHTGRFNLSNTSGKPSGKDVPVQSTGGVFFDLSNIAKKVTTNISEKVAELGKSVQISKDPSNATTTLSPSTSSVEYKDSSAPSIEAHTAPCGSVTIESSESTMEQQRNDDCNRQLQSVTGACSSEATTTPMDSLTPLPGTGAQTRCSSSPTQKSRFKKTLMKVEKTQSMSSSYSGIDQGDNTERSLATEQDSLTDNEASIQLSRKESDDSIPESDQGSEEYSSVSEDRSSEIIQSKSMSFTKEPGTGQTILWKEGGEVEENDTCNMEKAPKQPIPSPESNVVSYSVSIPSVSSSNNTKIRNKTKKQKAQLKREEKQKKKRKEKEECAKKANEAQESFDKESISSSTNSTDNFEDANSDLLPNDNSEVNKTNQKTKQSPEESPPDTMAREKDAAPLVTDVSDISREATNGGEDDFRIHVQVSPSTMDDNPLDEEEVVPEMETSYSTIEFKSVSSSTPSPDDLSNEKKLPPEEMSHKERNKTVVIERSISNSGGRDTSRSPPDVKPSRSSISAPSTPSGKGTTTTSSSSTHSTASGGKPRPSKLDLHGALPAPPLDDTDNSDGGTHDKSKTRLDPHELAASLLKNMPRPAKQKQGSNNGGTSSSNTAAVKEKELPSEEVHISTKRNNRKNKSSVSDNHSRDRRVSNNSNNSFTPLSSEAMPFYPHYPGMIHPRPGMPHPLPPPQPFPPSRGSIPSYSHHHVPNPSYEYPMMRPIYPPTQRVTDMTDQIHQLERKQRKRSEPKYPPKTFSPPTFPDGYHDNRPPYQYPVHEYESSPEEWMGSSPDTTGIPPHPPPGYLEDDPFAQSYPTGARRNGPGGYIHPSGPPMYNYNPEFPRSIPRSSTGIDEPDWDSNQLTADEVMYLRELRKQRLKKLMMERQQQQQSVAGGLGLSGEDAYEGLPSSRHSSDPFSLASLRDQREHEQQPLARHNIPTESMAMSYRNVPLEMDSDLSSDLMMSSLRKEQRKPSRDEYHWPSSSSASINRAPGPPGGSSPYGGLPIGSSGQSSSLQYIDTTTDTTDNWNKHDEKSRSTISNNEDDHSAWQSLWSMKTPLLSALEEQRQQAAKANNHNNYDPFEGNIWSLKKDDDTFAWITKPEQT